MLISTTGYIVQWSILLLTCDTATCYVLVFCVPSSYDGEATLMFVYMLVLVQFKSWLFFPVWTMNGL